MHRRQRFWGSVWGLLFLLVVADAPFLAEAQNCRRTRGNLQGVARAPITVSTTAVTVAATNTSRCTLAIINYGSGDMNCADISIDPVPTASTGILIKANGGGFAFQLDGQGQWQCIRTGGVDAAATVIEGLP